MTTRQPRAALAALVLLGVFLLVACQTRSAPVVPKLEPIAGSGTLEGRDVAIASELGGRIVALLAEEGAAVTAGETLVRLDDTEARAQVAQARAAVAAAEADVSRQQAGPRPAEIAAAEAAVQLATARLVGAEQALIYAQEAISNPITLDLQIAQARMERDIAEQAIDGAKARLDAEQLNYHIYVDLKDNVGETTRRSWDLRIQAAESAVTRAEAERDAAQANLSALYAIRAEPLQALAQLRASESAYTATLAAVDDAQARLDLLREGSRPEEIAIAEAQVAQARAAMTMALTQQSMLTLTAPISGVVATHSFHVGEIVPPGRAILVLTDLDVIHLTLYVPESRISKVRAGQQVAVTTDAYPGVTFTGAVERIGVEAEYTPGNVATTGERDRRVFAVRVRIPNSDHRLRPGIPAEAVLLP